jgi:pimeloyl-ACP methyl ester carboxylesterase
VIIRPVLVPSTGGVQLALHDVGGEGSPLLLSHANGFHGCVFAPLAASLRNRFHCWAIDYRGHGDSDPWPADNLDWSVFGDDALAAVDALGLVGAIGFGHSMGGTTLLMAALARPSAFAGLALFEPIAFPATPTEAERTSPIIEGARRRRAVFASREDAYDNYASKPPLDALTPEALRAYVDHGFVEQADGSVRLKCEPALEAAIFEAGIDDDTYSRLGEVTCPVLVLAGEEAGNPPGALAPLVSAELPHGRFQRFDDLGHLGPMQDPPLVATAVAAFADQLIPG